MSKMSTYLTVNVAPVLFPVSGFIRATTNDIKHVVRSLHVHLVNNLKTNNLPSFKQQRVGGPAE